MNGPKAHEQAIGEVQQEAAGGHRGTRRVKATASARARGAGALASPGGQTTRPATL